MNNQQKDIAGQFNFLWEAESIFSLGDNKVAGIKAMLWPLWSRMVSVRDYERFNYRITGQQLMNIV